jgi:uncharacterized protein YgiM (DUF1202 family)
MHMKNHASLKLMGLTIVCLSILALMPSQTRAEEVDCGRDPVYERSFNAKATVGSRVRSIACMTGSEILTVLPAGTVVPVMAETDGWYKVKAGDKIGWVGSQLLAKVSADTAVSTVKETPAGSKFVATPKAVGLVGISESNYSKLKNGSKSLIKQLKNTIILRVHSLGQAYFVDKNGLLTYLKTAKEVKDYLKAEIKTEKKTAVETIKNENAQISSNGTLSLTAALIDPGKVKLTWTSTADTPKGFKVVVSESANPVYPGNDYHHLTDPTVRQDTWSGLGNKTYHFRVCQYLGGACGIYSNDVAIQVSTNGAQASNTAAGTITLTATPIGDGKVAMTWSLKDMTSSKGFKVVISEQANPVYPGNDYHYYSEPNKSDDVWTGLTVGKTYHFRVCEYLGGYCGTYSNDVTALVK